MAIKTTRILSPPNSVHSILFIHVIDVIPQKLGDLGDQIQQVEEFSPVRWLYRHQSCRKQTFFALIQGVQQRNCKFQKLGGLQCSWSTPAAHEPENHARHTYYNPIPLIRPGAPMKFQNIWLILFLFDNELRAQVSISSTKIIIDWTPHKNVEIHCDKASF